MSGVQPDDRLRLALAAGRMGAWEWDIASGRVHWSEELEAIHGLEPGAFGGSFDDFQKDIHPEDLDRVRSALQEALKSERGLYRIEYRIIPPAGEVRWLETRGQVHRDANGMPVRMLGVCSDATERKRLQLEVDRSREAAERARDRYQMLVEASGRLAFSLDPEVVLNQLAELMVETLADYCVTYAVDPGGALRPVGFAHADPSQRGLLEELAPHTTGPSYGVGRLIRAGEPLVVPYFEAERMEPWQRSGNREALRVVQRLAPRSCIVAPLTARGSTVGAIALAATAVSGRRYDQDDLALVLKLASRAGLLLDNARLFREAQRAVEARDELVAIASHDLRNPLSTITTACDILDLETSVDMRAKAIASIRRASGRMTRLVEDLLDVSRIDAGVLRVTLAPIDLEELAREALELFADEAAARSCRLGLRLAEALPRVRCDRSRMLQVFSNLIGNALEHVAEGGRIEIAAHRVGADVEISVNDDGPGIPAEEIPHVFDRFWQGARKRRGGGVGLGLAIVRGIVEAHGGRIRAVSRTGAGTTFAWTLSVEDVTRAA